MRLALRFQEDLPDNPFFVDQKCSAVQSQVLAAIQQFLTPDSIFVDDGMIGVGDEGKGQAELFLEFEMAFLVVRADAQD
jgi:hypothetical protein